jgi:tRNA dimethylallyltransferase
MEIYTKPKVLIITGPTSSGKSDLAVELAIKLNGEIISADSTQVYAGLDIGTGKITNEEMRDVPHYALSYIQPKLAGDINYQPYTTYDFVYFAKVKIEEILNQNKLPIICGGTGLYIDALINGLESRPSPSAQIRKQLENLNLEQIQNILNELAPEIFVKLNQSERNNKQRLIRHIEANDPSNTTFKKEIKGIGDDYNIEMVILDIDPNTIKSKIEKRFDKRMPGMLDETINLLQIGVDKSWLSKAGLDYFELIKYLDSQNTNSPLTLNDLKNNIVNHSLKYVKKQITWNKRYANNKKIAIAKN